VQDLADGVRDVEDHFGEVDPAEFGVLAQFDVVGFVEEFEARVVHVELVEFVGFGVQPGLERVGDVLIEELDGYGCFVR